MLLPVRRREPGAVGAVQPAVRGRPEGIRLLPAGNRMLPQVQGHRDLGQRLHRDGTHPSEPGRMGARCRYRRRRRDQALPERQARMGYGGPAGHRSRIGPQSRRPLRQAQRRHRSEMGHRCFSSGRWVRRPCTHRGRGIPCLELASHPGRGGRALEPGEALHRRRGRPGRGRPRRGGPRGGGPRRRGAPGRRPRRRLLRHRGPVPGPLAGEPAVEGDRHRERPPGIGLRHPAPQRVHR